MLVRRMLPVVLLFASIAFCGSAALANVISINFNPDGNPDPTGAATLRDQITFASTAVVGVKPAAHWNELISSNGSIAAVGSGNLVDNTGAATTLAILGSSTFNVRASDTATVNSNTERLLNGSIAVNGNTFALGQIAFNNIPYAEYDVIVYFSAANNANAVVRTGIGVNSSSQYSGPEYFYTKQGVWFAGSRENFVQAVGTDDATATPGANYAVFKNVTAPEFKIYLIDGAANLGNASLYGIQIVNAVPEPALGGALMMALAGIGFFRRRR